MTGTVKEQGRLSPLQKKLDGIKLRIEKKRADKEASLRKEGFSDAEVEQLLIEGELIQKEVREASGNLRSENGSTWRSDKAALRVIEQGQLQLLQAEMRGDFIAAPITPGTEYPTILTRIGLFPPAQRKKLLRDLDDDLALCFSTSWGTGRKFGSPLTIYDEDTLLALGALRQRQLHGRGGNMPVKVMNPFETTSDTTVDVLYTTVGEIQKYLKQDKGGRGNRDRLASIKRLASVTIEFTSIADKKTKSALKAKTFSTKIIDLLTEEFSGDSALYVQFPPVMVKWLHESYTYIDMGVRRQLKGDTAKAIHRYLSSQPSFNIGSDKLKNVVEFKRDTKYFNEALIDTMQQLEALGWCEYNLERKNRKAPYILTGRKLSRKRSKD